MPPPHNVGAGSCRVLLADPLTAHTIIAFPTTCRRGRLLPRPPWPLVPSCRDWQTGGRQRAGSLARDGHEGEGGHGRSRPLPGRVVPLLARRHEAAMTRGWWSLCCQDVGSRPQPEDGDPSDAKTSGGSPDRWMMARLMSMRQESVPTRHGGPPDAKTQEAVPTGRWWSVRCHDATSQPRPEDGGLSDPTTAGGGPDGMLRRAIRSASQSA